MVDICLYFQVHQSNKLRNYRIYDIGKNQDYFDESSIEEVINRVGFESYFELNKLLLYLFNKYEDKFKVTFSMSGIVIEQMEKYAPTVLSSFIELAKTGNVEFLLEPFHNSLASIYSKDEFVDQINLHKKIIEKHFGVVPLVLKNTDLIYSNDLVNVFEETGANGVIVNGSSRLLRNENPNYLFKAKNSNLKVLVRNYELSKKFRKFSDILSVNNLIDVIFKEEGDLLNLFVDYDSFSQKNRDYLSDFVDKIIDYASFKFPSECLNKLNAQEELDVPFVTSWNKCATVNHLLGNRLQESSQEELYAIEGILKKFEDNNLINLWRKLTSSDHFFYMNVEDHFKGEFENCYNSPYDVYVYFMNALNDIILRVKLKEEKIRFEEEIAFENKKRINVNELKSLVVE